MEQEKNEKIMFSKNDINNDKCFLQKVTGIFDCCCCYCLLKHSTLKYCLMCFKQYLGEIINDPVTINNNTSYCSQNHKMLHPINILQFIENDLLAETCDYVIVMVQQRKKIKEEYCSVCGIYFCYNKEVWKHSSSSSSSFCDYCISFNNNDDDDNDDDIQALNNIKTCSICKTVISKDYHKKKLKEEGEYRKVCDTEFYWLCLENESKFHYNINYHYVVGDCPLSQRSKMKKTFSNLGNNIIFITKYILRILGTMVILIFCDVYIYIVIGIFLILLYIRLIMR